MYYFNIQQYNRCVNESLIMLEPYEDNKTSTIFIVYQNTLVCYYPDELQQIIYPSARENVEDIPLTSEQKDPKLYVWRTGQEAIQDNSARTNRIIGYAGRGARANLDAPIYKIDYINLFVDGTDLQYCFNSKFNTYFIHPEGEEKFIGTQSQIEPMETIVYRIFPISRAKYVFDNKIVYLDSENIRSIDKFDDEKELEFPTKIPFTLTEWEIAYNALEDERVEKKIPIDVLRIKNLKISVKSIDRIALLMLGGYTEIPLVNKENIFYLQENVPTYTPRRQLSEQQRQTLERTPKSTIPMYDSRRQPYNIIIGNRNLSFSKQEMVIFVQANPNIENLERLLNENVYNFEIRTRKDGSMIAKENSLLHSLSGDTLSNIYKYVDDLDSSIPEHRKYTRDNLEIRTDFPKVLERYLQGEIDGEYLLRYRWGFNKEYSYTIDRVVNPLYKLFLQLFFSKAMVGCDNFILTIKHILIDAEKELATSLPLNVLSITKKDGENTIVEFEWNWFLSKIKDFARYDKERGHEDWMFSTWFVSALNDKNQNLFHPLLYNIILISNNPENLDLLIKFFNYQQRLAPKWQPPYFPAVIPENMIPVLEENKVNVQRYVDLYEIYKVRGEIPKINRKIKDELRSYINIPHEIREFAQERIFQSQFNRMKDVEIPEFDTVEEAEKYLRDLNDKYVVLKKIYNRHEYHANMREELLGRGMDGAQIDDLEDLAIINMVGNMNHRLLNFYINKIYNLVREEDVPEEKRPEEKRQEEDIFILPENWMDMNEQDKYNLLIKLEDFYVKKFTIKQKEEYINSIRRILRDQRGEIDFNRVGEITSILLPYETKEGENVEDVIFENLPYSAVENLYRQMRSACRKWELLKILNRYAERRQEFIYDRYQGQSLVTYENLDQFEIFEIINGIKIMRKLIYSTLNEGDREFLDANQIEQEDIDNIQNLNIRDEPAYIIKPEDELEGIMRHRLLDEQGFPRLPNYGDFADDFIPPIFINRANIRLLRNVINMFETEVQKRELIKFLIENIRTIFQEIPERYRNRIPVYLNGVDLTNDQIIEELIIYRRTLLGFLENSYKKGRVNVNLIRDRLLEETMNNFNMLIRIPAIEEDNLQIIREIIQENDRLDFNLINTKFITDLLFRIYGRGIREEEEERQERERAGLPPLQQEEEEHQEEREE